MGRDVLQAVILYHGSAGDEVVITPSSAAAEALVLDYMAERWPGSECGPSGCPDACPDTFAEAVDWWIDGAFDDRWEILPLCELDGNLARLLDQARAAEAVLRELHQADEAAALADALAPFETGAPAMETL